MNKITLKVPNECPKKWKDLTITNNSKENYCSACEKVVIDFFSMTDEEIKFFFQSRAGISVCGRIASSEGNKKIKRHHQYLLNLHSKIEDSYKKNIMKPFYLFIISGLILLTGCEQTVVGEIVPEFDSIEPPVKVDSTAPLSNDSLDHKLIEQPKK